MPGMILTGDVNLMHIDDARVPFGRVRDELRAADIVFSNLECCLYDPPHAHSLEDEGFFAAPGIGGEALCDAGIGVVGIANNVNYGAAAIAASIYRLGELGIPFTGAGANAAAARAPAIVERHGIPTASCSAARSTGRPITRQAPTRPVSRSSVRTPPIRYRSTRRAPSSRR